MKYLLLLIHLFYLVLETSAQYTIAKAGDLNKVLEQTKNEKLKYLERLTALEFHKMLNNYRLENNIDTLSWDDILWLTARNHNFNMLAKDDLTHSEKLGEKYFTGEEPGDRLKFVQGDKIKLIWTGENCLYRMDSEFNAEDGFNNMLSFAKEIAIESLEQWKKSSGHNRNMLGARHKFHGVAFIFSNYEIYGTDLFGVEVDKHAIENENKIIPDSPFPTRILPGNKLSASKLSKELQKHILSKIKYENKNSSRVKNFDIAAKFHLDYLFANKSQSSNEVRGNSSFYASTPEKRVAKASYGIWAFLKPKFKNINETIAYIKVDKDDFDIDEIVDGLWAQITNDDEIELENFNFYGLAIKAKNKRQNIEIYAVFILNP